MISSEINNALAAAQEEHVVALRTITEQARHIEELKAEYQSSWEIGHKLVVAQKRIEELLKSYESAVAERVSLREKVIEMTAALRAATNRIEELEPLAQMGQAFFTALEIAESVDQAKSKDDSLNQCDAFIQAWQNMKAERDAARATIDQQNHTIKAMGEQASVWRKHYELTCPPSPG